MTARLVLVRHGQASFGSADYDLLSEVGRRQSQLAGRALAARRRRFDRVVSGSMRRHLETAAGCLAAMGHAASWENDTGWNEFDHQELIRAHEPRYADHALLHRELSLVPDAQLAFLSLFRVAFTRWVSGRHEGDYRETYTAFRTRVATALSRAIAAAGRSGSVLVFTSGGPIAAAVGDRLGLSPERMLNLAFRLANAGITELIVRGDSLDVETLNDHAHLDDEPGLLTHR